MQRIRLRRVGRKNEPHYQVVVTPHTNPAKGSFTAKLGWYNPTTKELKVNKEATLSWLNSGAQPSNTVAKLLLGASIKHKLIVYKQDTPKKPKKTEKQEKDKSSATKEDTAPQAETAEQGEKQAEEQVEAQETPQPKDVNNQPENNQEEAK